MAQSRRDLLFHPVRYRILRALNTTNLTTQGISDALGDVPQSTIYRHLRLLLKANIIVVSDSREINGITEKVYAAHPQYHLTADEFAALSTEEHITNIELFAMTMMQSVATALENREDDNVMPLSYREYAFYATEEEFLEIRRSIFKLLRDAEKKHDTKDGKRHKYKFNIVTHEDPS